MDQPWAEQLLVSFPYGAVFILLWAGGLGAPVVEELILLAGGFAIARTGGNLPLMMAAAAAGTLAGDLSLYTIGRTLGPRVLNHRALAKWVTPERLAKLRAAFDRYGAWTVFGAGFIGGVRAPTFLLSGAGGVRLWRFIAADVACISIFTPTIVFLGYRFGLSVRASVESVLGWLPLVALAIVIVVAVVVWRRRGSSKPNGEVG